MKLKRTDAYELTHTITLSKMNFFLQRKTEFRNRDPSMFFSKSIVILRIRDIVGGSKAPDHGASE